VANWLAAGLLAFTIFFYVVIYTMWLKRATPLNIVIGGAAGALPPVVGFAAASGELGLSSLVLFTIIFVWTPPHFWALALLKSDDYARAGIPMLPNVAGPDRTRLEILIYSALLAPIGVLPYLLGYASPAYGLVSTLAASPLCCSHSRRTEIAKATRRRPRRADCLSFDRLPLRALSHSGRRAHSSSDGHHG